MSWQVELQILTEAGVSMAPGLTTHEVDRAEFVIGAKFPPDLCALLSEGLPLGKGFPNWREPDSETIRNQLAWPLDGMAFSIENNQFWLNDWGERPAVLAQALAIARTKVADAPRLIPVYGHRYIAAEPELDGNPIFSVHQTDIIFYGDDLATYLRCEFNKLSYAEAVHDGLRRIRFWSELVDANNE